MTGFALLKRDNTARTSIGVAIDESAACRHRSYFSPKANSLSELSLSREPRYTARELSPTTWPDFERLFSKQGGVLRTSLTRSCWLTIAAHTEFFSTTVRIRSAGAPTD